MQERDERGNKQVKAVVPNLGPPGVLGLQLPEAFTTTSAGQDFWDLKSKNIWRPKVGDHWVKASPTQLSVLQWELITPIVDQLACVKQKLEFPRHDAEAKCVFPDRQ